LGAGLCAVNFCFQAGSEKSLLKMRDFIRRKNKLRYSYLLTPATVEEKFRLMSEFMRDADCKVRQNEAEQLELQILSNIKR
jgi:hypothetical protein